MLLLLLQLGYAGSAACAPCHPAIYRSYSQTPMARSSGALRQEIVEGSFQHQPSSMFYRIERKDGRVMLRYERTGGTSGEQQLQYFIGSGSAGRSYLFSVDRFLYQAPITYYSQKKSWDVSPGYEADREMHLSRAIEPNCLYCHASQVHPIFGTQNRYTDPPFAENGVGCERCHGPGAAHVKGGAAPMVNPARLDPARRDSVCEQCHLSGEARIERPGKKLAVYRPGELLSNYVTYYIYEAAAEGGLKATSHVEKLAQSRCKRSSGDRLWCGTCHNPHALPPPEQRAAYYRARCMSCHERQQCARGEDCAGCHMPRAPVIDGGHGVLTDHSIPRDPSGARQRPEPGRTLVPFRSSPANLRSLGLAYAEAALRTGDAFQESEAFRLLTQAVSEDASDAEVLTRLGHLSQRRGDLARAASLYQAALRTDPGRVVAAVNLGGIYGKQGRLEDGIRLWQDALRRNPALSEAGLNLALALRSRGEPARAIAALRQVLRFSPDLGRAKELLRELDSSQRDTRDEFLGHGRHQLRLSATRWLPGDVFHQSSPISVNDMETSK